MLSIDTVKTQRAAVEENIRRRKQDEKLELVEEVLAADSSWRTIKGRVDDMRAERNKVSQAINQAKKSGEDATDLIAKAKEIPAQLKALEEEEQQLRERIDIILKTLPNILHEKVPDGDSDEDNVERAVFGEPPQLGFEPKSHVEIIEDLGIVDFDAARRTSGAGFFFLKKELTLLDNALQQYAIDKMLEAGFTPIVVPYMVRRQIVDGMVDLAAFEETVYKVENEDLYLIPTSEFSLVGMLTGQDIDSRELPALLCGISPCFRGERGSHGIDEKGLFRTHQFHKIEQVVVCSPDESEEWFEKLLDITTDIFVSLGLHVRHLEMCTGDLGDLKHRQFDIECYSPRRNGWFEVGSLSNLTDAQARRLEIRMVHPDGTREYCHTLNNTAIATSRAMVGIIENFQQADGSVKIPEVLHPYMRGVTTLSS